jgi:hypothetical protein
MPGPTPSIERLVPVPGMSPAGFTVFSEISTNRNPTRALRDAFRSDRIPICDLPEIIANIWTWDDSPTSDICEEDWVEIFRRVGFFSWPPLVVQQPDGTCTQFRPASVLMLYRGSTADRSRRMSWALDRAVAEELGRRHTRYGSTALYKTTVAHDMVLAYLERRDDWGWTIVIDPAGLSVIERLEDIRPRDGSGGADASVRGLAAGSDQHKNPTTKMALPELRRHYRQAGNAGPVISQNARELG